MSEKKELELEDLEKVSGGNPGSGAGFPGPNAYEQEYYFAAGFLIDWGFFYYDKVAFHAGGGAIYGNWERVYYADQFIEYYKTHTLEEYVEYVRANTNHKDYKYNRGYDINS